MSNAPTNFKHDYDASTTEKKWQALWEKKKLYKTDFKDSKKAYYNLAMFPYPSGDKLHVGHWYNYGPADSWGRYKRMNGFNVFQPMGFDAFGLPAENYAIKTGTPPDTSTAKNVEKMVQQLKNIGTMYDWSKMVNTSEPDYYKWTQWLFLEMYKNGLAYKKKSPVNWCPSCKTVLANEQVHEGICERCKTEVSKKNLEQWFWKITDYAEELLDHSDLDWPEKTITMQKNWIGKSTGVNIDFKLEDSDDKLTCYTTRPDTIWSVTFVVIAAEHPQVAKLSKGTKQEKAVKEVVSKIKKQTDIERTSEGGTDKLGAFLGKYVINPVNGEKIPVYVANFALMYGTGVVMADAHDQRDFEFAHKYKIPLKFVISEDGKPTDPKDATEAFVDDGILFNSGQFSGLQNREALPQISKWMEDEGFGEKTTNYRLHDWLISRQRYWGSPIPIINCKKCGEVPVPIKDLPVKLTRIKNYKPKGKAPLAGSDTFMKTRCPKCKGPALREPDTMDTFVCSSWYYLRYPTATLKSKPFDKETLKNWGPVDMYIGGPEHACMHLLYARFVNMMLHNAGHVPFKEPFKRLVHQGMVTKDGAKMSKSKGNVVSPDSFVEKYGSDIFRMYLMFMGPFTQGGDWNDKGITGVARFAQRFWKVMMAQNVSKISPDMRSRVHKTVKKVTRDVEEFQFNTALAALMEFINAATKEGIDEKHKKMIVKLIAPMAPHMAEEIWEILQGEKANSKKWISLFDQKWPTYNEKYLIESSVNIVIQVNGKVRATIQAPKDATKDEVLAAARLQENVQRYMKDKIVIKEIHVPNKLVSFVVKG
jgi:leucyl-tRNA synthetase